MAIQALYLPLLFLPLTTSSPLSLRTPKSDPVTPTGACYSVPSTGTFTQHALYDFSAAGASGLPTGLHANAYPLSNPNAPCDQQLSASNVYVQSGALNLRVPGGQGPCSTTGGPRKSISVAEVQTSVTDILYASVRTTAKFTAVQGTCASSFFYASDSAEIDIEYLSSPTSQSNPNGILQLFYTNQPSTAASEPAPSDAATAFHEYRVDWTAASTKFYLDGALRKTLVGNVPQVAGPWLWNHWSNGDPGWTVGPPQTDAVYQIRTIEMYYNRTGAGGSC